MKNVLFMPSVSQSEWLHEILPWLSPAELPVAGRRFIDYALESAQKFGFGVFGILDWHFSNLLFADCNNLTARGIPVVYQPGNGDIPHGLNDLDRIASHFTNPVPDGLAVWWGLCLTSHRPEDLTYREVSAGECENTPMGLYVRKAGRWMRLYPQGIAVNDVRSWQRLSIAVLSNPWLFTLPGYSAEKDVYLGRNVILEHGTSVVPPVILQDDTWCARNVRLEGEVIVGQRSFIGEGAHLKCTIVGDDTYVGMGLELEDKIVVGHRIIDAATGHWTDVDEPGVAQYIRGFGVGWFRKFLRFLRGTSYGRRS